MLAEETIIVFHKAGNIAEGVRASALSHYEWIVPSSNPGKGW